MLRKIADFLGLPRLFNLRRIWGCARLSIIVLSGMNNLFFHYPENPVDALVILLCLASIIVEDYFTAKQKGSTPS